ncbi:hypothetical protein ACFW7J_08430, partial [Streptomyces sp. NPDC059525]|uniref:hypothetical protein n=1 Tax=Streptomyces sp. NPDC059525 TaxID=3346857 RepID=UPI00367A858B
MRHEPCAGYGRAGGPAPTGPQLAWTVRYSTHGRAVRAEHQGPGLLPVRGEETAGDEVSMGRTVPSRAVA